MNRKHAIRLAGAAALAVSAAGCGPVAAGSHTQPAAAASRAPAPVTLLTAAPTGMVVPAGQAATFTVTAYTAGMHPAAGRSVTFFIGPMTPLSGVPPKAWYPTGSAGAQRYVSGFSTRTDARGQATITLKPQGAGVMEMVGIDVGNLKTYDSASGRPLASLDAWWTTAAATPHTPPGSSLTVSPWVAVAAPHSRVPLEVTAAGPAGPVAEAAVTITSPLLGQSAGMTANGTMLTTSRTGQARMSLAMGPAAGYPVRIVATWPDGARVAGGINAALLAGAHPRFTGAATGSRGGM
ncbi:conserved exported protein of unknown function [Candidatus Hydrogenisulfobacillus filiaventi]|uniref:Uncharacterized protein n=1 Tax=Candidatus Hydrogenisulfobacillus filiaventi TaxID=2707344 RepID=A0A6F8ZE49_9FIRM|nr:conserved exported protein of unknown function [Candidatus Hydrogenisulfobacillus filiaventi]